ncbi:hypothetical protein ACP70R_038606 [Stipagrostis hirtigluma subsp. patula]
MFCSSTRSESSRRKETALVVGALKLGGSTDLGSMSPPPCPGRAPGATVPCRSSSKRRRLAPDEAETWASLPQDLVELIGWRVLAGDLLDYVRFRAVCTHWNSSTIHPRGRGLVDPCFHPRRWMLLPEGHGLFPGHPGLGGYVRFFNLSTGAFVRVHLPLFDDHVVLDSTDGLLLLLRHRDRDTSIRLLHPFTGDIAELPPLLSLMPQLEPRERYQYMREDSKLREIGAYLEGVCAAVTVSATGAITCMLALDTSDFVAHAMAGDQRWTLSTCKIPPSPVPAMSSQGKLYIVSPDSRNDNIVHVYQIDPPRSNAEGSQLQPAARKFIGECSIVGIMMGAVRLVECGSELMIVGLSDPSYTHPVVYRLADIINGRVDPVTNIGDHALFLGERALCVSSNKGFPGVLGNSITCDYRLPIHYPLAKTYGAPPVEHYLLGSGTWCPAISMDNPPASPYMFVHHILTCCHRGHWNKGLLYHGAIRPHWSVKANLWRGFTDGE